MIFEWDPAKDAINLAKHGISFAQAARIFDGVTVARTSDRVGYSEVRIVSYGALDGVIIVAVVHTDRSGVTRIISARPASAKERKDYYGAL